MAIVRLTICKNPNITLKRFCQYNSYEYLVTLNISLSKNFFFLRKGTSKNYVKNTKLISDNFENKNILTFRQNVYEVPLY